MARSHRKRKCQPSAGLLWSHVGPIETVHPKMYSWPANGALSRCLLTHNQAIPMCLDNMPLPMQKRHPSTRIATHLLAFRPLNHGQALFLAKAVDIKHAHLSFKPETVIRHLQAQVRIMGEVRGPCCMRDASRVASDTPNAWDSVTIWCMHEDRSLFMFLNHDSCMIGRGRVASPLHSNNILTPYPSPLEPSHVAIQTFRRSSASYAKTFSCQGDAV